MICVVRYKEENKTEWNEFNKLSKNYLFMFDRDYMDYHSHRFNDHSLMFYSDTKLCALLPMNEVGKCLESHGGLTYGGMIIKDEMHQNVMMEIFDTLVMYAKNHGFVKITYKLIPYIYHKQPAEEDRFALFANGATLDTVDVSTCVKLCNPIKYNKDRLRRIKTAMKSNIQIHEMHELESVQEFIKMENAVLMERHNTTAVHTGVELKLLKDRFPENIKLYGVFKQDRLIAGTVLYVYDRVVHSQYMAANEEGRKCGALDFCIDYLLNRYKEKEWYDFGISTEHGRVYLNEGLVWQKEGFGGRTVVYEIWSLSL